MEDAEISVAENDILHNKENIERIIGEIERVQTSAVDIKKVVDVAVICGYEGQGEILTGASE